MIEELINGKTPRKITYDKLANALYIKLSDEPVIETKIEAPSIIVDRDERGEVVGIEIIRAGGVRFTLEEFGGEIKFGYAVSISS